MLIKSYINVPKDIINSKKLSIGYYLIFIRHVCIDFISPGRFIFAICHKKEWSPVWNSILYEVGSGSIVSLFAVFVIIQTVFFFLFGDTQTYGVFQDEE